MACADFAGNEIYFSGKKIMEQENKRKIIYISNVRMPTEKAHGIQMIKMSEAFSALGRELIFVVPRRRNRIKEDPFSYYGVKKIFRIVEVPVIDLINILPWIGYWLETISFIFVVFFKFLFASRKNTIIYTREYFVAFLLNLIGFFTVYEAHRILLKKRLFFFLVRRVPFIITNSDGTAEEFIKNGFKRVLACPNGVDLAEFDFNTPKGELRKFLDLPIDKKIVMYTGNLYDWKGTDTLIKSAEKLSGENIMFVFIGGTDEDIKIKRAEIKKLGVKNVVFLGHKNRKEIPRYLKSADCLILPNSPISEESIKYTSPVKLAEYMASGIPIISSNLPSLRAILSEKSAFFVPPDDFEALKEAILEILADEALSSGIAENALSEVKKYTWQKRAEKILEFIG